MDNKKSIFQTLSAVNVNSFTEKKNNLTYLSWSHAWAETVKLYPNTTYEVVSFPHADGTFKPYVYDTNLGYLVQTVVRIEDLAIPMQLPVLDGANKAMKTNSYEYSTKYGKKTVEAATMFDINTAIMRCLTKNLAMFGLGHYIYAGEDVPQQLEELAKTTLKPTTKATPAANTETAEETKRKEGALKAFNALKKEPEILKHLVKEEKMSYASIEDFVKGESIEKILAVYDKVK